MLGAVVMSNQPLPIADKVEKPQPKRASLITSFFKTKEGCEVKKNVPKESPSLDKTKTDVFSSSEAILDKSAEEFDLVPIKKPPKKEKTSKKEKRKSGPKSTSKATKVEKKTVDVASCKEASASDEISYADFLKSAGGDDGEEEEEIESVQPEKEKEKEKEEECKEMSYSDFLQSEEAIETSSCTSATDDQGENDTCEKSNTSNVHEMSYEEFLQEENKGDSEKTEIPVGEEKKADTEESMEIDLLTGESSSDERQSVKQPQIDCTKKEVEEKKTESNSNEGTPKCKEGLDETEESISEGTQRDESKKASIEETPEKSKDGHLSTEKEQKPLASAKPKSKGIAMFFTKAESRFPVRVVDDKPKIITTKADVHLPPSPSQMDISPTDPYKKINNMRNMRSNGVVKACDMDMGITFIETITIAPPREKEEDNKESGTNDTVVATSSDADKGPEVKDESTTDGISAEELREKRKLQEEKREAIKMVNAMSMAKMNAVQSRPSGNAKQATLSFTKFGLSTGKVLKSPKPLKPLSDEESDSEEPPLLKPPTKQPTLKMCGTKSSLKKTKDQTVEEMMSPPKSAKKSGAKLTSTPQNKTKTEEKVEEDPKPQQQATKNKLKLKSKCKKSLDLGSKKTPRKTPKKNSTSAKSKAQSKATPPPENQSKATPPPETQSKTTPPPEESSTNVTSSESEPQGNRRKLRARFRSSIVTTPKVMKRPPIKLKIIRLGSSDEEFNNSGSTIKQRKAVCAQQILMRAKQSSQVRKANLKKEKDGGVKRKANNSKSASKSKKQCASKSESESQDNQTLRRSSRRSAASANAAISESFEEVKDSKGKGRKEKKETPKSKKSEKEKMKEGKKTNNPKPAQHKKKASVKLASIFAKKGAKSSDPIVIEDDVVPIDPETLKIRRAFLMSGVPETLKRQASISASVCLSDYPPFPSVSHVLQIPEEEAGEGIDPWKLKSVDLKLRPEPSLDLPASGLTWNLGCPTPRLTAKSESNAEKEADPEIPDDVLPYLVAEISVSNPAYPVRRVFKQVQKMKSGEMKDSKPPAETKQEETKQENVAESKSKDSKPAGKKRKKSDNAEEVVQQQSKRRRGPAPTPTPQHQEEEPPSSRRSLRRSARRSLPLEEEEVVEEAQEEDVIIVDSPHKPSHAEKDSTNKVEPKKEELGPLRKDLMWTEKYEPSCSSEFLGNSAAAKKLKSWLVEWKHRTDLELRRARKQLMKAAKRAGKSKEDIKKEIKKKLGSEWMMDDESDFELEDCESDSEEEMEEESNVCKATLLTGPHGVGKTTLVYALAKELGYKVFEVNASSRRNGRQILAQLQEATQSHQVSKSNLDSKYTAQMANEALASKAPTPKKLPTAFTNFFGKKESSASKAKDKGSGKKAGGKKDVKKEQPPPPPAAEDPTPRGLNLSSTSLVLFEEADVIFEEDKGFWSAIQTFMSTTKRPIVITCSASRTAIQLESRYEHLNLKHIPTANMATHLQLICLAENLRTSHQDVLALVEFCGGDLRHSLLTLQYWACSRSISTSHHQPISYSPAFFSTTNKTSDTPSKLHTTPLRKGPRGSPLRLDTARDSGSDFESSPIPKRRRRCARAIIEDESSMDSLPSSPSRQVIQGVAALDDDSQSMDVGMLLQRVVPECEKTELVTATVSYTPPVHVGCLESVVSGGVGKHNILHMIKECACSPTLHKAQLLSAFISYGFNLVYANQSCLLGLPTSAPIRRPSCAILSQLTKKPHSRIKAVADFSSSEDESSDGFVTLKKNKDSQKIKSDNPHEQVPKDSNPTEPEQKTDKEITQSERILHRSLGALADMYDTMSFVDAYMNLSSNFREGECERSRSGWGKARVLPGLTDSGTRWDQLEFHDSSLTHEASSCAQVLSVARARRCLDTCTRAVAHLAPAEQPTVREQLSVPQETSHLSLNEHFTIYQTLQSRHERAAEYVCSVLPPGVQLSKRAVAMDYLPSVRTMCRTEQLRQATNTKRRFLHYMDYISLPVTRKASVLDTLCSSFT